MMKWLVFSVLIIPAIAFSKSYDNFFENTPALSESILERQRGGFSLPGINYSIGLRMEALVNGQKVLFSNMFNLDRNSVNPAVINDVAGVKGLNITTLNGRGQLGFIVDNATNGVRADVVLHIDVVTPINMDTYRQSQRASTRVREAIRQSGY
ncbi:hypothetical protein CBP31_09145 [Oceanisphaera profunda]|uniref:Uncharacterized protein n=1 Tax=Oceanisphaera profunda TaxID=1416627 RepID=A0A1Y0D5F9_9GAMM|nr:hypothetical protein [Oceanisphaera profunda]ART82770.1 hypothetical protein CBP31_09145 [Oceanisphaera profunda]